MLFKEAISQRILNLCDSNNMSLNHLSEISGVPVATMHDLISKKVSNPSSYVIHKICQALKMELKEFFDCELFKLENISD